MKTIFSTAFFLLSFAAMTSTAGAQGARTCSDMLGRCNASCTSVRLDMATCKDICRKAHGTCLQTGTYSTGYFRPTTGLEKR